MWLFGALEITLMSDRSRTAVPFSELSKHVSHLPKLSIATTSRKVRSDDLHQHLCWCRAASAVRRRMFR